MIPVRSIRFACVVLLVAGLSWLSAATGASTVEELARRMPDETIGFVGTSGGDVLKGDFEKTALGRIWNDPGTRKFYQAIKTESLAKAAQESDDPNVSKNVDMALNYARLAISRAMLLGISRAAVKDGPPIGGFAILDAGDRKAEFAGIVTKLEAMIGQKVADAEVGSLTMRRFAENDEVPLYWGWVGNYFVIAANDVQGTAAKFVSEPRAAVPAYFGKVPANGDALVVHYDYQKIITLIDTVVREEEGDKEASMLRTAIKGLGLSELKSLTARVGFAGTDVVAQGILQMPAPTSGVLAACKPIDLAWLRAVDARAVTASAFNWDLAGLYDTIMNTLKGVLPHDAYTEMQNAISGFESESDLWIREGLLASLAGPALSYVLPAGAMPEAPMGGFVVVAKLKDAALFERAMKSLGKFAGERAEGMLQISEQERDDGRTVHVWAIAPLAMAGIVPSWSVVNDHVVFGSSEGLCDRGVEQLLAKGPDAKSLLDAEGFKKVAGQLPKNLLSFTYTDSQVQFNQTMMQLRQFWPMATMMAMQAQFKLPTTLPSLTHIAKDMGPSCSYSYYGADGLYSYHRGPGIEISLATVAGGAVGAGIVLPAMARAREQARITVAMSHLKQIGLALHTYAQENQDKFPSDLEKAKRYLGSDKMLESPRKPKDFEGPSYIYIPDQSLEGYPGNIVAYENPEFAEEKIVVLFLDGHVERMEPDRFQSELKETYQRLGRKMPGEESQEESADQAETSQTPNPSEI